MACAHSPSLLKLACVFLLSSSALAACDVGKAEAQPLPASRRADPKPRNVRAGEWQWFDDSILRSANDKPSGYAVRVGSDPSLLVIYLEGGGACFNAQTCAGARHLEGYGAAEFRREFLDSGTGERGIFARNDRHNPFRAASFAFLPHTSGDAYSGTRPAPRAGLPHFVGHYNVEHFFSRLRSQFAQVQRVVLAGSSAGGCGSYFNFEALRATFPGAKLALLSDSCPLLPNLPRRLQARWRGLWGDAVLPADCRACRGPEGSGFEKMPAYLAKTYPEARFALVSSERDPVMSSFFGFCYGGNPCGESKRGRRTAHSFPFSEGLHALQGQLKAQGDRWRVCIVEGGAGHVHLLGGFTHKRCASGERLSDFVARLIAP